MWVATLLVTAVALFGHSGAQQCLTCLSPGGDCSTTRCTAGVTATDDKLYIGGLFASTAGDIDGGPENVEHFMLAAAMINDKNDGFYDDLLPNTVIVAEAADSACSALPKRNEAGELYSQGAPGELWDLLMHHQSEYGHNMDAVVGPACSGASMAAAYFAEEFQIPMVSYSATSKMLSGRSPYFFRLSAPDSVKSHRVIDFMTFAKWSYTGIISTDTDYGKGMAASIKQDWLAETPGNAQDFNRVIDHTTEGAVEEAMEVLDQGTSKAVSRVVVMTGHTNEVGKMLMKIAEEDIGGTADSTCYVLTTDSVPLPENFGHTGWPENMKNGLFAVIVAAPDGSSPDRQPSSYLYQQAWKDLAPDHLGYDPYDTDDDRSTIHTYGWNTHDAVVAVASAYHRIKEGGEPGTLRDVIERTDQTTWGGPDWGSRGRIGVSGTVEMHPITHDRVNTAFDLMNLQDGTWKKVATIDEANGCVPEAGIAMVFPNGQTIDTFVHYETPPLALWVVPVIVLMGLLMIFGCVFTLYRRHHSKKRNAERLEKLQDTAEKSKAQALKDQAKALDLKKRQMVFPETWVTDSWQSDNTLASTQSSPHASPKIPEQENLPVPQDSDEYWDVVDLLRRPPNPAYARQDPNTGESSDTRGMYDAWITDLKRIQNPDLYAYYETQRERIAKTVDDGGLDATREVCQVQGWHGTGGFPAENIYNDTQDGFMMQFASEGQWGRGLYFAEDPGYSHYYASPANQQQNDLKQDEREMMLASIIIGNTVEMDRDNEEMKARLGGRLNGGTTGSAIKAPPHRNASPPLYTDGSGVKYNTITGFTQTDQYDQRTNTWTKNSGCPRSRVWIVYENGRAYPQYLVRYYRGKYDPNRVLYNSRPRQTTANRRRQGTTLPPRPSSNRVYFHVAPDGSRTAYSPVDCAMIDDAKQKNLPAVRLTDVQLQGNRVLQFEVRFGTNATSSKWPTPPASGMIQVNLANDFTREVVEALAIGA